MPKTIGRQIKSTDDSEKLQSLFQDNQSIMLIIDPTTQLIVDANPSAYKFYGWTEDELLSKKISDINILSETEIETEIQNAVNEKRQYFEFRHRLSNGEIRDVEVFSNPIQYRGEKRLFSIIHDITPRKLAEQEKIDIESMYLALIEQASEALFVHNHSGKFVQVNQQACDSLGYSKEELLKLSVTDIEQDFNLKTAQHEWVKIQPGKPFTLTGHHMRKDGSIFPVEIRFGCSIWKGEKVYISLARDITQRVQAEKELRESQIRFQTAFEYSAVGACMITVEGNFLFANQALCEMLGYTSQQLLGKHFQHFSHTDDKSIGDKEIQALFNNKESHVSFEKRLIHHSKKIIWADITLALLRDENGNPTHFIAQIQDITVKKEANEAIEKHRRALQLFIEYAPAAIAMFDKNMKYISASRRFYTDYELEETDIIGKSHYEVFPEIPEQWKQVHQRCLAGATEYSQEDPFPRKNGKLDWTRWEMHPWYESNNEVGGVILFSEVITEQKNAEKRIEMQLQRLKSLRTIDMAIINSFNMDTMLDVLLDSLINSLQVDAADILLIDPITNTLKLEAQKGFFSTQHSNIKIPLDKVLAGKSLLSRTNAYLTNIQEKEDQIIRKWLVTEESFVSYIGVPLLVKGKIHGLLEVFQRSVLNPDGEWIEFLESLAGQAAIAIDNTQLYERMRRANLSLSMAYEETIESWSAAMDLREKENQGHTQKIADLTAKLCAEMNMNESEIINARRGALLHDIGKIVISDQILLKPGPLSDEEWKMVVNHPQYAYEILSSIEYLSPALEIPYNHHERWNGSGYPRGLKEKQIPLSARIFSVIDVWDALKSPRPFRAAWSDEDALKYIRQESGKLFDPEVVNSFIKIIDS